MSFLAPKTELPNSMADNTPGRVNRQSPTQVVPLVRGRGRVAVQWVTPVLHWTFRTTSTSQYAFFSCYGWLALGPVDEFVQLIVNGKPYNGISKFREDYPGQAYVDHVISKETPERFRLWWGLEDHANYGAYIQGLVKDIAHPMYGKTHPAYRGIAAIAVQDMEAGQSAGGETPPLPKVEVEINCRSSTAYSFGYAAHGTHPVGIVRDLLTLKRGGLKLPASYFEDAHWTDVKQKIMDVGVAGAKGTELFTSHVFAEPKEVSEQLADVLSYIDGFIVERNGKLRIGYCPNDGSTVNPAGLTEINQHHLAGDIEDEPGDTDNMASNVIVTGLDWTANPPLSEASETAPVPFAQRFLGEQRPPRSYNRPGFTERSQLKSAATLMAAILANPDWKATVPVLRPYDVHPDGVTPLRPGDLFVLNTDQVGGANFICRILERTSDTPVSVVFRVQRERGTFPKPYSPALDPRASTTPPAPADLARYAVKAIPPAMAVVPAVTTLVERPSTSVNRYELHYSPTNSWPGQVIATLKSWAVAAVNRTVLGATTGDVTITVDTVGTDWGYILSQSALEQNDDTLVAVHGREWFSIGAITPLGGGSYSVALKRARLDSAAEAHANGDVFFFCYRSLLADVRHATFADIYVGGAYDAGQATKWFKLRPVSNGGQGNLTAAFSLQLLEPDVVLDDPNQYAVFIFKVAPIDTPPATPVGLAPAGWSDAPQANTDPTKANFVSKAIKALSTGAIVVDWSVPAQFDGGLLQVEWSIDGVTDWHVGYEDGDHYFRQRYAGGPWSDAIKGVGEDGVNGADGGDLVRNPDFALGAVGWESGFSQWDIANNLGEGGTRWGAKPNVGSPYQLVNQLQFRVKAGERYSIRAHGKGVNGYARITFHDGADNEVGYVPTANFAAGWGYREQYGSAPTTAVFGRAEFLSSDGDTQVDWCRIQFIPIGVTYTPPDEIAPPVLWAGEDAGGGSRLITLSNDEPGAVLKYRVNGGAESTYSGPFTVSALDVVEAHAEVGGRVNSPPTRAIPP